MNHYKNFKRLKFIALSCLFSSSTALASIPSELLNLGGAGQIVLPVMSELSTKAEAININPKAPMVISKSRNVTANLANGSWQAVGDQQLWQLSIHSPKALAMSVHFSALNLPQNAEFWLASTDNAVVHGPYNQTSQNRYGEFWSPQVPGNSIRILLQTSEKLAGDALTIASINHGTTEWWKSSQLKAGTPGNCNINAVCDVNSSDHSDKIRATARITYTSNGEGFLCSGTLLNTANNPNNAGDAANQMPYFLTANHCVSSDAVAATGNSYWNYQNSSCTANDASTANTIQIKGLLATREISDFSLLELASVPPAAFKPYWSGWSMDTQNFGSGVSVHHPQGGDKKISYDTDQVGLYQPPASDPVLNSRSVYVEIEHWEFGTTEQGSSGSGVWNTADQLIGQLTGGSASCSNTNGSDYYGWLGSSWDCGNSASNRLKDWLDPTDSGISRFAGYDHHNNVAAVNGDHNGAYSGSANATSSAASTAPPSITPRALRCPAPESSGIGGGGGGANSWLAILCLGFMTLGRRRQRSHLPA